MARDTVTMKTSFYTDPDLRPWHPLTMFFYRWLYENEHVHGVTGIGQVAHDIMRHESKLTNKQIERAIKEMGRKVVWFDQHTYWVVGRAKYTCYKQGGGINPKLALAAQNFLRSQPETVRKAFGEKYPDLIGHEYPTDRVSIPLPSPPPSPPETPLTTPTHITKESGRDPKDYNTSKRDRKSDAGHPTLRLLVDQFRAKARWIGKDWPVLTWFREAIDAGWDEGQLSEAIEKHAKPGWKPWHLQPFLAEKGGSAKFAEDLKKLYEEQDRDSK